MSKVKTVTHDLTHDAGKVKAGRRRERERERVEKLCGRLWPFKT